MRATVGLLLAGLLLSAPAARGAEEKVVTQEVTFKSGDDEVKGYLAMPEGKGPFPAIVIIQEWWGLTDWIKENAEHFAKQGYIALAPDLYRGKVARDMKTASKLSSGLPRDRAVRDLKAATSYLASHERVKKDRLGSIGWCMGGMYSLQLALNDKRITACAICYGRVVTMPEQVKPLNATILGVFGKEDMGIKVEDVEAFEQALKKAGKKVEAIKFYEAGHGFMRPGSGDMKNPAYRAGEAKKAWAAIDRFFAKTLKDKES
jgi:carboxymethylenebutenolidase